MPYYSFAQELGIPRYKHMPYARAFHTMRVACKQLPHLNQSGEAHMISISHKPETERIACACGMITFSTPETAALIRSSSIKKGDVIAVSRIAAISATKAASTLIPLAHPQSSFVYPQPCTYHI